MNSDHQSTPKPQDTLPRAFRFDADETQWFRRLRDSAAGEALGSIGDYELLDEIGRGGQGVVFKARQPRTGREIAVKRLSAGAFATPEMRARFEREIEAAVALDHPNIVTVFGTEVVDHQQLLAMKWVDGVPIDRWAAGAPHLPSLGGIKGGSRRPIREILEVFTVVCEAVHHAHQRGVIHRDLKPSNILVDRENRPFVLDFGLAKVAGESAHAATLTMTGEFLGTPAYAAPEQIRGDVRAVDVRTDVYALGAILYRLLTGDTPFADTGDLAALMHNVLHREPPRPSSHDPRLNREIDVILLKALAQDKEHRYMSVAAFSEDIRRFLGGQAVLAHPPSTIYQVRKFVRQHRVGVTAAAAIATLLLASSVISTALYFRGERQRLRAEREAVKAKEAGGFVTGILSSANRRTQQGNPNVTVREVLDRAAADLDSAEVKYEPEVEASIHRTIAETYKELDVKEAAERHYLRAIDLYKGMGKPGEVWLGECMDRLGSTYRLMGRIAEAERMLEGAVHILHSRLPPGEESVYLAQAQASLAVLKRRQGKLAEAEALYLEALPIYRKYLGLDDDNVWQVEKNLAWLYYAWGRLEDAEPRMRETLAQMQRLHPEPNSDVAMAQWQLGAILFDRGDPEGNAESLIRQGLNTTIHFFGPGNSDAPKHRLAMVLAAKGQTDEAAQLYLDIFPRDAGDYVLSYAADLVELSRAHERWLPDAENALRRAIDKHEPVLGPTHVVIAGLQHHLGIVLLAQGLFPEAESALLAAEAGFAAGCDADFNDGLCGVRVSLAELYEIWPEGAAEPGIAARAVPGD